jgi:hypothetical protein
MMKRRVGSALALALAALPVAAAQPQVLKVAVLGEAPAVDGNLADWGKDGWIKVAVKPAVDKAERARLGLEGEDRNYAGSLTVQLKLGVAKGRFYLAARWPDAAADTEHKGWEWSGGRYVEGKKREDMFAVRLHLDGDYDRSMLAAKSYRVDTWLWSSARTDPIGLAEDPTDGRRCRGPWWSGRSRPGEGRRRRHPPETECPPVTGHPSPRDRTRGTESRPSNGWATAPCGAP